MKAIAGAHKKAVFGVRHRYKTISGCLGQGRRPSRGASCLPT